MRFDEVELETVVVDSARPSSRAVAGEGMDGVEGGIDAPRLKRLFALLIDLSLFAAVALGLSPLLADSKDWISTASLAGFVVVVSFYYFVGTWLLWGKTIGGAIFDVRVVSPNHKSMPLKSAVLRWVALYASILTAGIGFLLALLPSRRSLADRISSTYCITAA
jgi:uncharacterized RDD family membrane protein YckC